MNVYGNVALYCYTYAVLTRLRVVPHFSSGIVEPAKRESTRENHPTREKATRGGEIFSLSSPRVAFSRVG